MRTRLPAQRPTSGDCEQSAGILPPRAQTSATIALGVLGRLKPCSPSLRPLSMPWGLSPSSASMQTGWWYCPIRVLLSGAELLLTPPAPSTAAEGAGGLSVGGCSGDDAELRAPESGLGVTLVGVELVHVPRICDGAEDVPTVLKRCSHSGKAIQESLGGLRAHRIIEETARDFWRRWWARRTRQASSRSQSVAEYSQECSESAQAWLRVTVSDWPGLTYCAASSTVSSRPVCWRTSASFIGFMGIFLSGALRAPDATSPLNCC